MPPKKNDDASKGIVDDLAQFYKDSENFFNKCTRPDRAEYTKIL